MNTKYISRSAHALGISVEEYQAHIDADEKWCIGHKAWHPRSAFGLDRSQGDGMNSRCREWWHRPGGYAGAPGPKKRGGGNRRGWKASPETRQRMSEARQGSGNANWKGGVTPPIRRARQTAEYYAWRQAVFERDNYTCQHCGKRGGGTLHAHHIRPFCIDLEGRYDVDNGLTLCEPCHKRHHYSS